MDNLSYMNKGMDFDTTVFMRFKGLIGPPHPVLHLAQRDKLRRVYPLSLLALLRDFVRWLSFKHAARDPEKRGRDGASRQRCGPLIPFLHEELLGALVRPHHGDLDRVNVYCPLLLIEHDENGVAGGVVVQEGDI